MLARCRPRQGETWRSGRQAAEAVRMSRRWRWWIRLEAGAVCGEQRREACGGVVVMDPSASTEVVNCGLDWQHGKSIVRVLVPTPMLVLVFGLLS